MLDPGEVQLRTAGKNHDIEDIEPVRLIQCEQRQATARPALLHVEPRAQTRRWQRCQALVEAANRGILLPRWDIPTRSILESQTHPRPQRAWILCDLVVFTAHIARRLLDLDQKSA